MKKIVALLLSIFCIFSGISYIFAENITCDDVDTKKSVEYMSDGSYIVTELKVNNIDYVRSFKSGEKSKSYYSSSNVLLWKYTVKGTFSYNGSSSSCVSASSSVTYTSNGWKEASKTSYPSGNSAVGKVVMKYITGATHSATVVLSCSPSGSLS